MKIKTILSIAVGAVVLSACSKVPETQVEAQEEAQVEARENLFNGTNLDGWSHVLVGEGVKREDVWSVKDGTLICKGTPLGYLVTNEAYQDFTMTFEWRWAPGAVPGNSGVLLRIAGEPASFMPKCVEAQLKHENAGDVWGFFGASVDGPVERILEVKAHETLGDFKGVKKIKLAEKAPGDWNQYEITVSGSSMELKVNGELVNQVSGLDVLSGPIGLQSEGAEIHFRNIQLVRAPL